MMRIMFRRCALSCALGLAALLSGCRRNGVQGCLDLLSAQKYRAAARRCAAVFAASGDPRAGAAVVRAHYFLGQEREALAWADRLEKAGKVAPGVWSVVGTRRPEARRGRGGGAGLPPRSGRLPRRGGSRPRRRRPLPALSPLVAALQLPADLSDRERGGPGGHQGGRPRAGGARRSGPLHLAVRGRGPRRSAAGPGDGRRADSGAGARRPGPLSQQPRHRPGGRAPAGARPARLRAGAEPGRRQRRRLLPRGSSRT